MSFDTEKFFIMKNKEKKWSAGSQARVSDRYEEDDVNSSWK